MFCPRCGNNIKEGSVFCTGCGFKLELASEPENQPLYEAQQTNEDVPVYDEDYKYNKPITTETPIHYKHSADVPKKSNRKKTVISTILIVAILAFSVISFLLLNGINGKWVYDECLINEKSLSESFKETADNEKSLKDSVNAVNNKYKNDNLDFIFGNGTVNFNGVKTDGPYEIIDNKLYVNKKSIAIIESDFSTLKLTIAGHPLGNSEDDGVKTTVIFQRNWIQLVILGGVFLILVVALIVNLLTGRKPKNKFSTTVDAIYDLAVNPLNDESNTDIKPDLSDEASHTTPQYIDETFNKTENSCVNPEETNCIEAPVSDFKADDKEFDNIDLYATKYAPAPQHVVTPEQTYNSYVRYETKYISNQDIAPKAENVEIIISPENSIPDVKSEEYSIAPGTSPKDNTAPSLNIAEVPTEPMAEAPAAPMAKSPAAPMASAAAAAPKKPANPFFKSAGDL